MNKLLKEIFGRLPLELILVFGVAYFGYDYYTFHYDPSSELLQKEAQLVTAKAENEVLKAKVKEGEIFFSTLDQKKIAIREYARRLDQAKASLPDTVDMPQLMKSVITEAKRAGITVVSLKPSGGTTHENYIEQKLELKFKGSYVQMLVLLDHLSVLKQIVHPDDIALKPQQNATGGRIIILEGQMDLKTFTYKATSADDIAKGSRG